MLVLHDRRVGQHQGALMHSGPVEPIQPVGVTKDSRMSARYGLRCASWGGEELRPPTSIRVSSEGSDPGPASVGAAIYHDMTLVDSSDDDDNVDDDGEKK